MNLSGNIITEVKKVISGKERVLWWILTAILARGHILIEDIPGVGKTTIALAFSKALGLDYGRVQFTPDVLPSDITGYTLYNKDTGAMTYQPGAILCNLFLADELNRATSRTQSALLEAMEEGQVTVDGTSHQIPKPFTVIATQNPTGASGTSLLPDSQLDRFSVRLSIGYPSPKSERSMVLNRQSGDPLKSVKQITSKSQLISMQSDCDSVFVKDEIVDYIVELIGKTRNNSMILRGASPRTTLSITALSKAMAYINGRDYVIPDDVGAVFCDAVEHRILLAPSAEAKGISGSSILEKILDSIKAPSIT
ncbi:MAG: MoxR family ATPase [Clostridia bacterium]|nr:MoxR family ATPase [Clostridia bacterium]